MRKRLLTLLPAIAATFLVVGGFAWAQTTNLASLRVGTAGEGGVTFFNGSIVNESGPVVVADDLRVDGVITRLDGTADKPVRVNDEFNVTGDVTLDEDLAVTGDVTVTGDLTAANQRTDSQNDDRYVSQSSPSWDAQTAYYSVPASAFVPITEAVDYTKAGSSLALDGAGPARFYAPVHLPEGATVTEIKMMAIDQTGTGNIIYQLNRHDDADGSETIMANVTTTDQVDGTVTAFTDDSITEPTISNSDSTYWLQVQLSSAQAASDMSLQRAQITYTATAPY